MTRLLLAAGVAALALISAPATAQQGQERGQKAAKQQRGGAERPQRHAPDRQAARVERRAPERQAARIERRAPERQTARVERRAPERQAARIERNRQPARERIADRRQVRQQIAVRHDRHEQRVENRAVARRIDVRPNRREQRADNRFEQRRIANRGDARRDVSVADRVIFQNARNDRDRHDRQFTNRAPVRIVNVVAPYAAQRYIGQTIPAAYRERMLPVSLRSIYSDTPDYYYRYGDDYLYRVNRRDNLVAALLPLLGAGFGVGQQFPTTYMNSYVPSYYSSFYPDSSDMSYRYANGYVYGIDPYSGMIENTIPAYGYGYGVGQRWPSSYSYYNVPDQYRSTYYDTPDYYYRYAPGAIYQVDRDTSLIAAVASLLTGGMAIGQQMPIGYDAYNVPYGYRDRFYDTPDNWYRYSNGNIYQIDPTTRLVSAIVQAIV